MMKDMLSREEQMEVLSNALLTIQNKQECINLLTDLCTIHELQAMAQRLQVARLLRDKITYQEIASMTGASTATISRVNRCLTYGSDGYNTVLNRMEGDK